ncbi:MAG: hypothetical protein O7G87_14955 [bacterium]|nr:hypothetical protein [bacterium]
MKRLTQNIYYWPRTQASKGYALILDRGKKIVLIDPPCLDAAEIRALQAYGYASHLVLTGPRSTPSDTRIQEALNASVHRSEPQIGAKKPPPDPYGFDPGGKVPHTDGKQAPTCETADGA